MVESHYLDPSLFKQTFFVKENFPFFLSFSTLCFFNNISFQTCQFFFVNFQLPKNIYFFWRKRIRHSFFQFFSSFIQNKTLPYFEKETEWETIFFVFFFRNLKYIFLFWQESNFPNFNDVIKFINTKQDLLFFYRKSQHTCICFIINLQKKY